jgi:catechol 2,3-dioxygenase-like lactoylglutathione lyase family enzyme
METTELHRGRLIDHLQLVVRDLPASRRFYQAVLEVLGVPIGGEGPDFFWVDELFISSIESRAAAGKPTGRTHLAFQAKDRAAVDRFHAAATKAGGKDNGPPGNAPITPATTPPSCSTPTATTSRWCTTAPPSARPTA